MYTCMLECFNKFTDASLVTVALYFCKGLSLILQVIESMDQ